MKGWYCVICDHFVSKSEAVPVGKWHAHPKCVERRANQAGEKPVTDTRKHTPTPGPWKHLRGFPTSIWAGDGDSERWLASTNVEPIPFEERVANARLMAASWELLQALTAFMDACAIPKQDMQAEKNAIKHAYELGRAAIAKAEAPKE